MTDAYGTHVVRSGLTAEGDDRGFGRRGVLLKGVDDLNHPVFLMLTVAQAEQAVAIARSYEEELERLDSEEPAKP